MAMYRGRSIRTLAATGAALLALSACGSGGAGGADDEIVVGVVIPLSGATASVGESIRHGYEMAEAEINKAGGIDGQDLTPSEHAPRFPSGPRR